MAIIFGINSLRLVLLVNTTPDCSSFGAHWTKYFMVTFYRFLSFSKYHIPREMLLNKTGDVTEDGQYVTPYKVILYSNVEWLGMAQNDPEQRSVQTGLFLRPTRM